MSLNTRVGLLLLLALAVLPLWLPIVPFVLWWLARERQLGQAAGLRSLPRFLARTLTAFAEATLPRPPQAGWQRVAHNVDAYLAAVNSPRHWRTFVVLTMLEFAPCSRLRPPLSRMSLPDREQWIARHLSTTRGLLAVPALIRQLVRMGYYTDPSVARDLGFRTMRERTRGTSGRVRLGATGPMRGERVAG